jgi:hypothetical protein
MQAVPESEYRRYAANVASVLGHDRSHAAIMSNKKGNEIFEKHYHCLLHKISEQGLSMNCSRYVSGEHDGIDNFKIVHCDDSDPILALGNVLNKQSWELGGVKG